MEGIKIKNRKRQGTKAFPAKNNTSLPRKVTGNNSLTSVRKGYCYLQNSRLMFLFNTLRCVLVTFAIEL